MGRIIVLCLTLLTWSAPAFADTLNAAYLYALSNFTGPIPYAWVPVTTDAGGEVYVGDSGERSVAIFNENGMEVFRFGDDDRLGIPRDLVVLEDGDILLLSYPHYNAAPELVRCNYRGDFRERIVPNGLTFQPDRMVLAGDQLYFVSTTAMLAAAADLRGNVQKTIDIGALLQVDPGKSGLGGFAADPQGRILFTVPVKFKTYRLSADGHLESFGDSGSTAGKFGVVAGVATDAAGRIYVVDTLRCVVLVFQEDFQFINEIGGRSYGPGGLIAPRNVTVGKDGKVYVTQRGGLGVQVFRVTPPQAIGRTVAPAENPAG